MIENEKPNSVCKWCGRPIKSGEYCKRHENAEPVAEPAEPSASPIYWPCKDKQFSSRSSGLCSHIECKAAAPQPVARSEWKPCPICQSDYDGVFCHACRNQPAQPVAACTGIVACTQKEACLKVNRCLINLPQPVAGEGPQVAQIKTEDYWIAACLHIICCQRQACGTCGTIIAEIDKEHPDAKAI